MKEPPLTRQQIVSEIRRWQPRLRRLGSRWSDSLPADVRKELLDVANGMLAILLRERVQPKRGIR